MTTRILVADDNLSVRQAIRFLLQVRNDWEICAEATNGEDAVAKANQSKPDIIIMDLQMPGLDGFQAASQILAAKPLVPIILYSVFGTSGLAPGAARIGIRRVLSKSECGLRLVAAIDELLTKSHSRADNIDLTEGESRMIREEAWRAGCSLKAQSSRLLKR